MSRRNWLYFIIALFLLGVGTVFGFLLNNYLLAGDGEASETISAPTLDINALPTFSPAQAEVFATENAQLREEVMRLSTQVAESAALEGPAPDATEEAPPEESGANTSAQAATERVLFRIVPEESEVRFNIDEVLRGQPITVVGRTNQVAGDIIVDFASPQLTQVGTVRVNVRTLTTPEEFRNQALRARILQSAQTQYEFSEFVPAAVSGLPATVAVGDTFSFQITGDLTVRGVTNTVTFDAAVTVVSEDRIEGLAQVTVLYRDFNLRIPDVSFVTGISDEVLLEIQFVAARVES